MIAEVLVEIKAKNIDKTFSYLIPKGLKEKIEVGIRVLVPFGKQKLEGFVLKIKENEKLDYELKEIISLIDEEPVLNKEMLELGKYISQKTLCNLISAYQTMLPSALKAKKSLTINKKYITYLVLNKKISVSNEKQKEILKLFENKDKVLKKEANDISVSSVKTLIKKEIIKEIKIEEYRLNNKVEKEDTKIKLNDEQNKVIKEILNQKNKFQPFLLHGVTGSGKTEVYMHLIEEIIKEKKEAIVLVPEISLTPQLVSNFKKRFGSTIAILHSRLSNGEKYDEWRKIQRREVKIVIGARSAIFAPLTNLGIIIIDEEHEMTYKQENNPKYNAIDIALWRGRKYNIPIVLGSATPKIESYTRAKMGIYHLCELKKRVNDNLPKVTLIDMKDEIKKNNRIISGLLDEKIKEKLDKNEQIILLLNRRGYSTIVTCKNCGYVHKCPACDIPLIYHKSSNTMRCHYCGYGSSRLKKCPSCGSIDINDYGMGTEKLEQYIKENYSKAKVIRMDNDTTSTKGSHEKIINSFRQEKYNVLIGTQMIAKGLDFPKVTLVGVINGDAILNIPDFRSGERTFQLLNQVAGRAGRASLKGEVIIQGFNIDHYSIKYASSHDYNSFYKKEMEIRKILKYSPYYNLCYIKISSKNYDEAYKTGEKITDYLKSKKIKDLFILGPTACNIPKINNVYYLGVILKYKDSSQIFKELKFINNIYAKNKVNVDIDIDPNKI